MALALAGAGLRAAPARQAPVSSAAAPGQGYRLKTDVGLVVLYASVLDERGNFVPSLQENNFRVYEDKVEQKLSVFRREDVPVSLGLIVDNSGSMRDKREKVNAAALTFVETSNPQDEVFVVNFNDEFFLDLDKDFTSDVRELREALERVDSRGGTAMYAALVGSMDHLKKATHDKKALLVITDGEDNASGHITLQTAVEEARKSGTLIYAVGLLNEEEKRAARHAKKDLTTLATETGGAAFFPNSVEEVQSICTVIARDIRNQYVLAYYPTNMARDGSFRMVHVELVNPPRANGKLS
ncbi:MAG TPA: VWA domain-containing protein, partial [Candidatus Acidoferrales bacterium]|nr:VWA domain-containing protein [Candidatus Acidoferrales bacterium]